MSNYHLIVERIDYPDYKEERYFTVGYATSPVRTLKTQILDVQVTEAEWERIKRAVLEGAK